MLDNLRYAAERGPFKSYFICEQTNDFTDDELRSLTYIPLAMNRGNVSPFEVIRCIWQMFRIFRREHFDIIQYASSNAGLYASIAGWLARVPVRIYCQWGISYTDFSGVKQSFYKFMDVVTCLFATNIQPDSYANLNFAIFEGLYPARKGSVIHKGSATGVDTAKFNIDKAKIWRKQIRCQYSIPNDAQVLGFVGRLVPEKGINELFSAFMSLSEYNIYLIVVGPEYEVERLDQELWNRAKQHTNIILCGSQPNTAPFYAAMDYLVLPSYREGFGSVVLEAGAMQVPSICSNIKGPTEFVKDMQTGIICEPMSDESLRMAMSRALALDDETYRNLALNAYKSVKQDYDAEVFRRYYLEDRIKLLKR